MSETTRKFVGVGYQKGNYINVRISKEKLMEIATNEKGDFMLTMGEYKSKGKASHWISVDDWAYNKMNERESQAGATKQQEEF